MYVTNVIFDSEHFQSFYHISELILIISNSTNLTLGWGVCFGKFVTFTQSNNDVLVTHSFTALSSVLIIIFIHED